MSTEIREIPPNLKFWGFMALLAMGFIFLYTAMFGGVSREPSSYVRGGSICTVETPKRVFKDIPFKDIGMSKYDIIIPTKEGRVFISRYSDYVISCVEK